MEELTSDLEIEKSRNELLVPIDRGIYLHSIYNPEKEAEILVSKFKEGLSANTNILVLGLGFAYHINEIIKNSTSSKLKIMVIEPNKNIIETYLKLFKKPSQVQIKFYNKIEEYFYDYELIDFLMLKPLIIKLETSFNLDKDFYKQFFTYRSHTSIDSYKNNLSKKWNEYFSTKDTTKSLEKFILPNDHRNFTENDYLIQFLKILKR